MKNFNYVYIFCMLLNVSYAKDENYRLKLNKKDSWCIESDPKLCISNKYQIIDVSNNHIIFSLANLNNNEVSMHSNINLTFKGPNKKNCFNFNDKLMVIEEKKLYGFKSKLIKLKKNKKKNFGLIQMDIGMVCLSYVSFDELSWDNLSTVIYLNKYSGTGTP